MIGQGQDLKSNTDLGVVVLCLMKMKSPKALINPSRMDQATIPTENPQSAAPNHFYLLIAKKLLTRASSPHPVN